MATTKELLRIGVPLGLVSLAIVVCAYWSYNRFFDNSPDTTQTPIPTPLLNSLLSLESLPTSTPIPMPTETIMPTPGATAVVLYLANEAIIIPLGVEPDPSMPDSCRAWYPEGQIYPINWSGVSTAKCIGGNIWFIKNIGGGVIDQVVQGPDR